MFGVIKSWDNRREVSEKRLPTINGRTWTRRIQWLEDSEDNVKLKFWDGEGYYETRVSPGFAQKVWDRFKEGQTWDDALSIFRMDTPKRMLSRKAGQK